MPKIDFTGEPDKPVYVVLPTGKYKLAIQGYELKEKKDDPATKYFKWTFVLAEGAQEGAPITTMTTLKKGKRWLLRQLLKACDCPSEGEIISFEEKDVVGKCVTASVKLVQEIYKGESRDKNTFSSFEPAIPF